MQCQSTTLFHAEAPAQPCRGAAPRADPGRAPSTSSDRRQRAPLRRHPRRRQEARHAWSRRPGRAGRSARRGAGDAASRAAARPARPTKASPASAASRSKAAPGEQAQAASGAPQKPAVTAGPRRRRPARRRPRPTGAQAWAGGGGGAGAARRGRAPPRGRGRGSRGRRRRRASPGAAAPRPGARSTSASPPSASRTQVVQHQRAQRRRLGGERGDVERRELAAAPAAGPRACAPRPPPRASTSASAAACVRRRGQRLGDARVERLEPRQDLEAQDVARVQRRARWSRPRRTRCRRARQYSLISAAPRHEQRPRQIAVARPHAGQAARRRVLGEPVQDRLGLVVAVVGRDDDVVAVLARRAPARGRTAGRARAPGSRRPASCAAQAHHVQRHAGRGAAARRRCSRSRSESAPRRP